MLQEPSETGRNKAAGLVNDQAIDRTKPKETDKRRMKCDRLRTKIQEHAQLEMINFSG